MGRLILVTGGARSGKSGFAEQYVAKYGKKIAYIATSQCLDEEMAYRIKLHRQRRPESWVTYEAPFDAHEAILKAGESSDMILFDCLTLYISNLLCSFENLEAMDDIYQRVQEQCQSMLTAIKQIDATVVVVTNEVGTGIVPMDRLSREFRDQAGLANQLLAQAAQQVYLVVAGIPVDIKKLSEKL